MTIIRSNYLLNQQITSKADVNHSHNWSAFPTTVDQSFDHAATQEFTEITFGNNDVSEGWDGVNLEYVVSSTGDLRLESAPASGKLSVSIGSADVFVLEETILNIIEGFEFRKTGDDVFLRQKGTNPGVFTVESETGGININVSDGTEVKGKAEITANNIKTIAPLTIDNGGTRVDYIKVEFEEAIGTEENYMHTHIIKESNYDFDPGNGINYQGGDLFINNKFGAVDIRCFDTDRLRIHSSGITVNGRVTTSTLLILGDYLRLANLPTSPSGLTAGQVWKDTANGNVLKIV